MTVDLYAAMFVFLLSFIQQHSPSFLSAVFLSGTFMQLTHTHSLFVPRLHVFEASER